MSVFIADKSPLRERGLILAFATSPYIFTTFAGGPAAQSILSLSAMGWRWGSGMFTIVVPTVVLPLVFLFLYNQRKAT